MTSSGAPFWSAPKRFPRPLEFSSSDSSIFLDFVDSFEHHECKCLGITYVREKSITKNSQQQKGLAHHGISRLWVSDCPVSVFIYDDPLRGLVLAWEVTHIMGRCGLIANVPHRRGIKTTYAKWNIATESQVSLLLQVQWDPGGHHLKYCFVFYISLGLGPWRFGTHLFAAETAWGQAVFQGGKYVRDLMG
jgi:hypothetical protein